MSRRTPDPEPTPDAAEEVGAARPWGSYADWLVSGRGRDEVVSFEQRSCGSVPVDLALHRHREAYPDPPTPDLALALIRTGGGENVRVDFGHGRFDGARPGQFVLAPADHFNDIRGGRDFELLSASFPAAAFAGLIERAGLPTPDLGPLHAGPFGDDRLMRLVVMMWADTGAGHPHSPLYADGLFTAVAARLMDLAGAPPPPAPRHARLDARSLARVEDYMRAHLADGAADVGTMANLAGYSRFHFSRLYRAATGDSPKQRLIALRLERARSLLRDRPEWSVDTVALRCGFGDPSHLARHFRRAFGLTPARFRDGR